MENLTNEVWKCIPNTNGYYISNFGRLKIEKGYSKKYPEGCIKDTFYKDKDGYYKLSHRRLDGTSTSSFIHRLVAQAFIPNDRKDRTCVNHIDNNRNNNRVENLEWVTPKENVYHSYIKGNRNKCLQVPKCSKLTSFQISQISFLRQFYSLKKISELFNINYQSIKNIVIKLKKQQSEILDNQQPSIYTSIYNIDEGSTTIP